MMLECVIESGTLYVILQQSAHGLSRSLSLIRSMGPKVSTTNNIFQDRTRSEDGGRRAGTTIKSEEGGTQLF